MHYARQFRYQNIDRNPVLQIGCEEAKKISREPREDATIILGTVSRAKLSNFDISWEEKGAVVWSLGVIVEGCINGLFPHLQEIVAFRVPLLNDKLPLVRRIT
jgi:hypothetical protein